MIQVLRAQLVALMGEADAEDAITEAEIAAAIERPDLP